MLPFLRMPKRPRRLGRLIAPQFVCLSQPPSFEAGIRQSEAASAMWQAAFDTFRLGLSSAAEGKRYSVTISRSPTTPEAADVFDVQVDITTAAHHSDCPMLTQDEVAGRYGYSGLDLVSATQQGLQLARAAVAATDGWRPSFVSDIWRMDDTWLHVQIARFSIAQADCPSSLVDRATHDVCIRRWRSPNSRRGCLSDDVAYVQIEMRPILSGEPPLRRRLSHALNDQDVQASFEELTEEALQLVLGGDAEVTRPDPEEPFKPTRHGTAAELHRAGLAAQLRIF